MCWMWKMFWSIFLLFLYAFLIRLRTLPNFPSTQRKQAKTIAKNWANISNNILKYAWQKYANYFLKWKLKSNLITG